MSKIDLINLIKTEIEVIYLTSDGKKFLDEYKAIIHESDLEDVREQNRRWEKMKIELTKVVLAVLKNERWGIFFKNEPIQTLPVQDSASTLYKINEVKEDLLVDAIERQIEKETQEGDNEWQKDQAKNASQTDRELLHGIKKTLDDTNR